MANDFSAVLPVVMAQSLKALREQAILTRLINKDFSNVPAGQGDTVNVTLPAPATASAVTPSATPIVAQYFTPSKVTITLDQWKKVNMVLTDKELGQITSGITPSQVTEQMKAIANDVNSYFYGLYTKIYGFAGAAGTEPFNTNSTADARAARKILNNQLAPMDNRRGILNPNAEENALGVDGFTRYDALGNGEALMTGQLSKAMGIDWFMDQLVPRHVSTALSAGAATVNGVQAINAGSTDNGRTGTLSIAKATNTSPLIAGDILTIAGFTQTYVVVTGVTLGVGNTTVTISPALKQATAGSEVISLKASHTVNLVFHRDAMMFASRPLETVDGSGDTFATVDPQTGIALRGEIIRQHKQTVMEWDVLYGGNVVRPEFACRLAGA